eukprot:TRINITY_DN11028_c0_g1_i1.p1 TRINITY_DN11028_c0_g1~~TRINITY_DN11028_c0_g1_i1.p1  ORF type:complete len:383 (-),score=38.74 TRINITY_DN11028_c0_g1_i1:48-1169(-)
MKLSLVLVIACLFCVCIGTQTKQVAADQWCIFPFTVSTATIFWQYFGPGLDCLPGALIVGDAGIDGISGFFDAAFVLFVDNTPVLAPLAAYQEGDPTSTLLTTVANTTYSGLQISFQHYFVSESDFPFLRVIYSFSNTLNTPVTFNADIQTNFKTNERTLVYNTSSGDTDFTVDDRWITTYDSNGQTTTSFFFYATDTLVKPIIASLSTFECSGQEGVRVVFPLVLQPNENVSLALWAGLYLGTPTADNAITDTAFFVNRETLPSEITYSYDSFNIINWPFPRSITPSPSVTRSVSPTISLTPSLSLSAVAPTTSASTEKTRTRRPSTPTPHTPTRKPSTPTPTVPFISSANKSTLFSSGGLVVLLLALFSFF